MKFSAKEIASFLNGEIVGNQDVTVSGLSKIEEGKPGTLTFFANPKYENFLYTTNASIILISREFKIKSSVPAVMIKVDDAYQAFGSLLDLYMQAKKSRYNGIEDPVSIDKSAKLGQNIYIGAFTSIGKDAVIGDNVHIFPQVFIGDNVTIGNNTIIYAGAKIYEDTIIGSHTIIHAGAVIGSDGFGFALQPDNTYKKIPQIGNVILEDYVEIGANTTIDCSTLGSTIIRSGAKIDNLVQIGHNCEIGENTVIAGQTGLAGTTKVGKNCRFAGQVGLAGHLTIGDNVQIGAQSGVTKSIKDNQIVFYSPAMPYKEAAKTVTIMRNLPKLREELIQLQKDVRILKERLGEDPK